MKCLDQVETTFNPMNLSSNIKKTLTEPYLLTIHLQYQVAGYIDAGLNTTGLVLDMFTPRPIGYLTYVNLPILTDSIPKIALLEKNIQSPPEAKARPPLENFHYSRKQMGVERIVVATLGLFSNTFYHSHGINPWFAGPNDLTFVLFKV